MSMLTTVHKFKRRSARASPIFGRDFESFWKHVSILDWKNGVKCIMLFVTILWLCSKLKPSYIYIEPTLMALLLILNLQSYLINCVTSGRATRDLKQRKLNYPLNYQYGIDLQIDRKLFHVVLLILLAGDVVTNPGPVQWRSQGQDIWSCTLSRSKCRGSGGIHPQKILKIRMPKMAISCILGAK